MNKQNRILQAVLFDVDGTLADTEQDGHRPAFNAAFKEAGLSWDWDVPLYGELLKVTGGKERIRHYIEQYTPEELDRNDLQAWIAGLHQTKTKYFEALLTQGKIPLRPGVTRLLNELRKQDIIIAIATTTTLKNVTTLLETTLGKESIDWFAVIGAGDIVPHKKPAPDIFHWVMDELNLTAQDCIAIEDSANGLQSSMAADLPTIITINNYTHLQNFEGASIVLSDLGEPDQPFSILNNYSSPYNWVNLEMMRDLITNHHE